WEMPPELTTQTVDRESGKLATEWCPPSLVYREIFIPGTEPTEACDLHGPGIFGGRLRGILPDTAVMDTTAGRGAWPDRFRPSASAHPRARRRHSRRAEAPTDHRPRPAR